MEPSAPGRLQPRRLEARVRRQVELAARQHQRMRVQADPAERIVGQRPPHQRRIANLFGQKRKTLNYDLSLVASKNYVFKLLKLSVEKSQEDVIL
jgi:hypothetical protein